MGYKTLNNSDIVEDSNFMKESVTRFIREYCEDLRFEPEKEEKEKKDHILLGISLSSGQIPYNMQMDIERLCLEKALTRFLDSGRKQDAFDVYFCYLEMFVGEYKKTRRMIELLSEYEANGSGLLMKHRDHYSHSVYVFSLGLVVYVSSSVFRTAYKKYYFDSEFNDEHEIACHFLKYWGLTALFHDIGYPFELPFEQISSYFEVQGEERSDRPYVAYKGLDSFRKLDKYTQRRVGKLLGLDENHSISTTDELFAHILYEKLGKKYYFSENEILNVLRQKPTEPERFGYYMDHAYFSATILFKELFCSQDIGLEKEYLDALTAILLHNSLYKFSIAYYKNPKSNIPFDMNLHPLAYMLMLCDELQCWDRTAYGRNSKQELHPMDAVLEVSSDNRFKINYIFDESEKAKINSYRENYEKWRSDHRGKCPKLKAYSSMYQIEKIVRSDGEEAEVSNFQADIERIVDLSQFKLEVTAPVCESSAIRKHKEYLSHSNFISLYNFAVALHARWSGENATEDQMYEAFKGTSLEYKLSNINQAKMFDKYLNEIGAFYTDRPVDFNMVESFTPDELVKIGPLEHKRWLEEHYEMGWGYIRKEELERIVKEETGITDTSSAEFKNAFKGKREMLRKHWDMIPDYEYSGNELEMEIVKKNYERIGQEEQDKDTKPMDHMVELLKKFDGLRIYRLS